MTKFDNRKMKCLREAKGYTLNTLANELSVTSATISRYETGEREPNLDMIGKIASSLDVYIMELIKENKEQTMAETYTINLRKEVLKEYSAAILADILKLLMREEIEDDTNPISILSTNLANVQNNRILHAQDMKELDSIEGYLEGMKIYVQELIESFHRGQVA